MDAYELARLCNKDVDEIMQMPLEKFNEWRAFFLLKSEKVDG